MTGLKLKNYEREVAATLLAQAIHYAGRCRRFYKSRNILPHPPKANTKRELATARELLRRTHQQLAEGNLRSLPNYFGVRRWQVGDLGEEFMFVGIKGIKDSDRQLDHWHWEIQANADGTWRIDQRHVDYHGHVDNDTCAIEGKAEGGIIGARLAAEYALRKLVESKRSELRDWT